MPGQTLAQLVRAKYPGAYEGISDQALESLVRQKYPGIYDAVPSTPPVSAEDFTPKGPEGLALGRFAANAWSMVNPIEAVKGIASAVAHPIDTVSGLVSAQGAQFGKAAEAAKRGGWSGASQALGHAAAGILPIVGPAAANVGEQIGSGDVAGGLGAGAGLVGGVLTPGAVRRYAPESIRTPVMAALDPIEAAAVEAGKRAGVVMDAATATGNRFVRAVQHIADRSLGGSMIAERAAAKQAEGLATMGEQLAAKANARPKSLAEIAAEQGEYLHGSSAEFSQFKQGPHKAIYLSNAEATGRKTQAEHIAGGPFGGQLYAVKVDASKLKTFNPLNDATARQIYEKLYPGQPAKQWVEYPDMPEVIAAAEPHGYNDFRVREPAVQGFSRAITDPTALKITARVEKGADGSFTRLTPGKPVTIEQAGEGIQGALRGKIGRHRGEANTAYERLREIEADPANQRAIDIEPRAGTAAAAQGRPMPSGRRFAPEGASTEQLWQGVLGDARRNGFKGSADDLKVEFMDRLRSARELGKETAEAAGEVSGKALLDEIRRLGGIRPFTKELVGQTTVKNRGDFASIVESFGAKGGWSQRGGASIFRKDGLAFDDLIQQLGEHPHWKNIIQNERDLFDALDDIARQGPEAAGSADFEHLLRGAHGIEPGAKWWEGSAAAKSETMGLPVDLRPAKEALAPIYQELMREAEITPPMGGKGRALATLDRLMKGPDDAPLSVVDGALSDLKKLSRPDAQGMRTAGAGAAAQAVKQLDDWVKVTAENAGPEALSALEAGRAATVAKYDTAGILKALEGNRKAPVRVAGKLLAAQDTAVDQLRQVAKHAPQELPKLGRAFLDRLLERATAEGGFKHADAIASKWEKLGAETKRLLYRDPAHIAELDKFFRLARMTAKSANPSGTAHTLAAGHAITEAAGLVTGTIAPMTAAVTIAGPAALSKLLHSPAGVRLLTEGYRIPLRNAARRSAWAAQVAALVEQLPEQANAENVMSDEGGNH
jgi:hypothetical protein